MAITSGPTRPISLLDVALLAGFGLLVYEVYAHKKISSDALIVWAVLIPSIILHEISHGLLAYIFGDDTAKLAGRLTLNPIKHVDIVGTILVPAILVLSGGPSFGWAKPVPVNVSRMSRNKAMFTGLVGPATNIAIAGVATVVINLLWPTPTANISWAENVALRVIEVNVVLAIFNLIPIPPLDGSAVLERFLPDSWLGGYLEIRRFSILILMFIMLQSQGLVSSIIDPALSAWAHLLP